ncbi:lysoplasmalogenase [Sphingomonas sp. C3-2]|uniref:lysoplasmalogenase n=1 Tax=Sphingomonas sp. C3-2 TaxID=3062169 RepID=UPI00294B6BDB|nr:lysoplasmalogenase [Sphingomonas sp. C3-2]WOK38222.1 lysoplasmalogenase [Sphingomonas sp. C3-2]
MTAGLVGISLFFGITYPMVWGLAWPALALTLWKGAGVGFLALAAMNAARDTDGLLLAIVLACGAVGDVLLVESLVRGAIAFAIGHGFAIWLYLRNQRAVLTTSQKALAILVVPLSAWIAWTLPTDRMMAASVSVYTVTVAAMAACAWISRFPRYWTGIGAMLFLVSDLLIFARMGVLTGAGWVSFAVWAFYYGGQFLICMGVLRTLRK